VWGIGRDTRIEGVILDTDCGLVDKNDLQCNVDNIIINVKGKKDRCSWTVEMDWFIVIDKCGGLCDIHI